MINMPAHMANLLNGESLTNQDVEKINIKIPLAARPVWILSFLQKHNLAGLNFTLSDEDDLSGIGVDFIWLNANQMISESCDVEPGISITSVGLLPVGACAIGSGDPYFLDFRKNINNPALVRVPHDFAVEQPYPLEKIELVMNSMNDFFTVAKIG